MNKVWSYGDSHAAGHELGNQWSDSLGTDWLNYNFGVANRDQAIKEMGADRYRKIVKEKWYKQLDDTTGRCRPELSYAGEFANLVGYTLVNRANPGNSNSHSVKQMLHDMPIWKNDDIILFSVCTFRRYISASEPEKRNHQIHWLDPNAADIMLQHGPHDDCFKMQTLAYISLIKSMHTNVIVLQTVSEDISVGSVRPTFTVQDSFTDFSNNNSIGDFRYPGGHIHESLHKQYSKLIYESYT